MDFGPWWYAPAAAALLAGIAATSSSGVAADNGPVRAAVLVIAVLLVVHQILTRKMVPRSGFNAPTFWPVLGALALIVGVVFVWTVAQSLLDLDGAAAYALLFAGWAIVTGILLAVRSAMMRARRTLWAAV
ncbi:MAG: hypothetical protein ACK5PP_04240 [Acidimicrobiales bacterium]